MSRLRWRLIPYILLLYIIAMIDRVNIGVAALTMNKDLGLSAEVFGSLAGIFFITYFIFEVPSNAMLHKIGARIWIARILITWGIVAVLQILLRVPWLICSGKHQESIRKSGTGGLDVSSALVIASLCSV